MGKEIEKLEYEDLINEIIDLILEKKEGTSRKEMNEQIKKGVENGFSPEVQLGLIKLALNV